MASEAPSNGVGRIPLTNWSTFTGAVGLLQAFAILSSRIPTDLRHHIPASRAALIAMGERRACSQPERHRLKEKRGHPWVLFSSTTLIKERDAKLFHVSDKTFTSTRKRRCRAKISAPGPSKLSWRVLNLAMLREAGPVTGPVHRTRCRQQRPQRAISGACQRFSPCPVTGRLRKKQRPCWEDRDSVG